MVDFHYILNFHIREERPRKPDTPTFVNHADTMGSKKTFLLFQQEGWVLGKRHKIIERERIFLFR